MAETINNMKRDVKEYKNKFEFSEKEVFRLTALTIELQQYVDVLENRATDAEVIAEEAAASLRLLETESKGFKEDRDSLTVKLQDLQDKMDSIVKKHKVELEESKRKLKEELTV
jgi:hypothetical protein